MARTSSGTGSTKRASSAARADAVADLPARTSRQSASRAPRPGAARAAMGSQAEPPQPLAGGPRRGRSSYGHAEELREDRERSVGRKRRQRVDLEEARPARGVELEVDAREVAAAERARRPRGRGGRARASSAGVERAGRVRARSRGAARSRASAWTPIALSRSSARWSTGQRPGRRVPAHADRVLRARGGSARRARAGGSRARCAPPPRARAAGVVDARAAAGCPSRCPPSAASRRAESRAPRRAASASAAHSSDA